jgi:putative transposase
MPIKELCRKTGIRSATCHRWKSKHGGLEASDSRRVLGLEAENAKLERMDMEPALDNAATGPDRKNTAGLAQKREPVR